MQPSEQSSGLSCDLSLSLSLSPPCGTPCQAAGRRRGRTALRALQVTSPRSARLALPREMKTHARQCTESLDLFSFGGCQAAGAVSCQAILHLRPSHAAAMRASWITCLRAWAWHHAIQEFRVRIGQERITPVPAPLSHSQHKRKSAHCERNNRRRDARLRVRTVT